MGCDKQALYFVKLDIIDERREKALYVNADKTQSYYGNKSLKIGNEII